MRNIKSQSKNVQVQYVYHGCLFLIFDQTTMAQEQKYLRLIMLLTFNVIRLYV